MTTPSRRITPTIIRPRLMLEAASEMMGADRWPFLRARLTLDAPLDVPLHPAAERFWQECGYLTRSG